MSLDNNESEITSWRANPADGRMTILELLRADHVEIMDFSRNIMLEQEDGGEPEMTLRMFLDLKKIIHAHSRAEEIVFYSAIHDYSVENQDDELRFDVIESFEEHYMIQMLLEEIATIPLESERWTAKFLVLIETLERHIEKEEANMFLVAQKDLDFVSTQSLALEFLEEKDLLADASPEV